MDDWSAGSALTSRHNRADRGQGRKTDATDAHSVALVGTRMAGLRPVVTEGRAAPRSRTRARTLRRAAWLCPGLDAASDGDWIGLFRPEGPV